MERLRTWLHKTWKQKFTSNTCSLLSHAERKSANFSPKGRPPGSLRLFWNGQFIDTLFGEPKVIDHEVFTAVTESGIVYQARFFLQSFAGLVTQQVRKAGWGVGRLAKLCIHPQF